jgi:hypothetical protein
MAIRNIRQTASGFTATNDADGLSDDPLRHMPDRELVGTHLKHAGFSYAVEEDGDNVHIVRTKNGAKTKDATAPSDPVLDYAANVARNRQSQAAQDAYWSKPAHLR